MNTWYQIGGKTYQCQISNAGGWFIGVRFLSSMTFPWLLMIFQSSMTFHDFSRKFYFSRFSRPCGNPVIIKTVVVFPGSPSPLKSCYVSDNLTKKFRLPHCKLQLPLTKNLKGITSIFHLIFSQTLSTNLFPSDVLMLKVPRPMIKVECSYFSYKPDEQNWNVTSCISLFTCPYNNCWIP